jgi:protein-S-isoprenylcysteine O-methyltransferase Ste14
MSDTPNITFPKAILFAFRSSIPLLIFGAVLFLSAGSLSWTDGWIYFGALYACAIVGMTIVALRNPGLAAEQARMPEGTKSWDKIFLSLGAPMTIAMMVTAGLDERWGWSPEMPLWLKILALVILVVIARVLSSWALSENKFYSGTVWIQEERGHRVCETGPYRLVRHPAYLSAITQWLVTPFILGSYWALIPAGIFAILITIRTKLEDDTLQTELPGYKEFTHRTRYRLLPGIW